MTAIRAVFLLPGLITSYSSHVFLHYSRKKKKFSLFQAELLSLVHPMLNSQAKIFYFSFIPTHKTRKSILDSEL